MSAVVNLLDHSVLKWMYRKGWKSLRPVQEAAVHPIMLGESDVIISAATAAGKTEAFFLPAISAVKERPDVEGIDIIYISPLKALINDQERRLESLCDMTGMQSTSWHGDSSQSKKAALKKNPNGILLITPESLESLLMRHSKWLQRATKNLSYIVIDEFHSFLDSVRGVQLVSQLNRLEHLTGRLDRPIPRVALSATLGEIEKVPGLLRPNKSLPCKIIKSPSSGGKLLLKIDSFADINSIKGKLPAIRQIIDELYLGCRGGNHLIFSNSRSNTEMISALLEEQCEKDNVPNEFFPHHGSLSKHHREEVEKRLQRSEIPTTAVCTMTLELGIDIGKTDSVFQVGPTSSVSSLRQRMGRSGRRDGVSVLRIINRCPPDMGYGNLINDLNLSYIQMLAIVKLMIVDKWFEPPCSTALNLSTLLHQTLSVVAQWGGVQAFQIYNLLCKEGRFNNVSADVFKDLLRAMAKSELIRSLDSGEIILDTEGENLVDNYQFFATFHSPEEYRIFYENKEIGTLPAQSILLLEQSFLFGGKSWRIVDIEHSNRTIRVTRAKKGAPPIYEGASMLVHSRIRREMYNILSQGEYPLNANGKLLNEVATDMLDCSIKSFQLENLSSKRVISVGSAVCIFTWLGDKQNNLLLAWLLSEGFDETASLNGVIVVPEEIVSSVMESLFRLKERLNSIKLEDLAGSVLDMNVDKFDEYLTKDLLKKNYSSSHFDMEGLGEFLDSLEEN